MKQKIFSTAFLLLSIFVISSCEKSNYEILTTFHVRLASVPFDTRQLNIDIKQVQVRYSDNPSWVLLKTPEQVYDLSAYENGIDTLIAEGTLPATSIVQQMKLVLGTGNTIRINGKFFPLITTKPETEVILDVNKKLNRKDETVKVVFDPSLSISQTEDGTYQFDPRVVLKK